MKAAKKTGRSAALLGIGLDGDGETRRLTRGEDFVLFGGSHETHATMQETVLKVTEHLKSRGQRLEDVSARELRVLFEDVSGQ